MITCTGFRNLACHSYTLSWLYRVNTSEREKTFPWVHFPVHTCSALDRRASHNGCHAVIPKSEKSEM